MLWCGVNCCSVGLIVVVWGSTPQQSRKREREREIFLYKTTFTITTDHKPLETICNEPTAAEPTRLQRITGTDLEIKGSCGTQCHGYQIYNKDPMSNVM